MNITGALGKVVQLRDLLSYLWYIVTWLILGLKFRQIPYLKSGVSVLLQFEDFIYVHTDIYIRIY